MVYAYSLAAAFVTPALFYGGAAAVAAPILIHLLARRRFKRIRWAAMDFLIDAERRNRRRLRMEEWILLALRCLAVLFIATMVARPFLRSAGAASLWGGAKRTERVFLVDDSLSMAYETPQGPVFARAKQAVRQVLESIRRETPDDTVTFVRMSAPTTPIELGTYLDGAHTEELLARLDALAPSQRSIDPAQVIAGIAEILERNPGITNTVIYVISDFQRKDWVDAFESERSQTATDERAGQRGDPSQTGAGGSDLVAPLADWAADERALRLVLINVGEDEAANVAITELDLQTGRLVAGTTGTVQATVANFTDRPLENVEIQVSVGNLAQPSKTLRGLGPQQTASVDVEAEFIHAGSEAVRVEVPPDALPADNVRHVSVEVADAIRILIVNGEPSPDSFEDEVTFLTTALRPEGEVFSGNELVVVDEAGLEETELGRFHVVVLANVYRVSDPAVENLERFVRRGGGALFFLGDQVDADLYNVAFYREGEGLLPAEVTEVVRAVSASHLIVTDRLHPAVRGLGGRGDPLGLGHVAFFEYFGCVPFTSIEPDEIADLSGVERQASARNVRPQATAVGSARVIARFDDADEHAALVERRFGKGRVILITTSADKEWHLWPDHPTFLPTMMELAHYVAKRGDSGTEHWVGEPIEVPLDPAAFEPDAVVRTPAYPTEPEVSVAAAPSGGGQELALHWDHTDSAGVYQFVLQRRGRADAASSGEVVRLVTVNIDPGESDLTMAQEDELRRSMGGVPLEYVKGIERIAEATGEARTELWRVLLFATAAVLMIEQFLAWTWGRRG